MNTHKTVYTNTDRAKVLLFVQSLEPTPAEAPFVASVFEKSHVSMKDVKLLLDYVARRAAERPLQADCIKTLGLPSLPA